MAGKRVKVTSENQSGRNTQFQDTVTGEQMTRAEFVKKIEQGVYPNYHVRVDNDVKTPASNLDGSTGNNLG